MRRLVPALAALLLATPAAAQESVSRYYFTMSGGYAAVADNEGSVDGQRVSTESAGGWTAAFAIGRKFGPTRLELEASYTRAGLDGIDALGTRFDGDRGGDLDVLSGSVNGFYDFRLGLPVTPYVGAGIGLADATLPAFTVSNGATVGYEGDDRVSLMALGEAGFSFTLARDIMLVPSYRYTWIDNGTNGLDDTTVHTFKLGIRSDF